MKKESEFCVVRVMFSSILWISLLLTLPLYSQEEAGNTPAEETKGPGKVVVCVGKFENKTNATDDLFQNLRTHITNEIVNTRKFEVVEREQFENVISEMELAQRGMINEDNVAKPGDFISAGYGIYGSVLSLGYDHASGTVGNVTAERKTALVEIQLRLSDLKKNKIIASKEVIARASQSDISSRGVRSTSQGTIDPIIEEAIRRASLKIVDELMELAYPIKILSVQDKWVFINLPKERAKIYDIYNVYNVGEELIDPDTGESLGNEESFAGKIKIIDIKPKYAVAVPEGKTTIDDLKKGMIVRPINQEKSKIDTMIQEEKKKKEFEQRF